MGIGSSSRRSSRNQHNAAHPANPRTHVASDTYFPNPPDFNSPHVGIDFPSDGYTPRNGHFFMNLAPAAFRPPLPPLPYVAEHQKASTIRNDVNLKKQTLHLEKDEENPGFHLVAFSFDATVPGSISIFFHTKEGPDCSLTPLKPHLYKPIRFPFDKGLGQTFRQAPGTGVNLSLFEECDLLMEGPSEVYPLVVRTETIRKDPPADAPAGENEVVGAALPKWVNCQTTHGILEIKDGDYAVKVVKQIIWVDSVRYELQEIYGIENSEGGNGFDGTDSGKECVICMSELRDTTVLPCRHMCMCSGCAKVLRYQTNRCPICRTPVEKLLEIKVPKNEEEHYRSNLDIRL